MIFFAFGFQGPREGPRDRQKRCEMKSQFGERFGVLDSFPSGTIFIMPNGIAGHCSSAPVQWYKTKDEAEKEEDKSMFKRTT